MLFYVSYINVIILVVIDLHMHSEYSDGTCPIEEILAKAKSLGLSQISITDHNILEGSIQAKEIADINFIIGTELSVGYNGTEVHLLGYFPNGSPTDYKNVKFIVNSGEAYKKIAIMEMIENLNAMGYDIKINELSEFKGPHAICGHEISASARPLGHIRCANIIRMHKTTANINTNYDYKPAYRPGLKNF